MSLLPIGEEPSKKDGLKAHVVLYTVDKEEYTLRSNLESDLSSELVSFLKKTNAKSSSGDVRVLWCRDKSYNILCAVGVAEDNEHTIRRAGAVAYRSLKDYNVETMVLSDGLKPNIVAEFALLASFSYDYLKKEQKPRMAILPVEESSGFRKSAEVVSAQNFCRFLAESPANLMTPQIFTEYVRKYLAGLENIEL